MDHDHHTLIAHLHSKQDDILNDFAAVLEKHGIKGAEISRFGLYIRTGPPPCPGGKTAAFRCGLNAGGEYECRWVCD